MNENKPGPEKPPAKQPYEPPRIELEETFEVMSAVCNATEQQCTPDFNPGSST